MRILFDALRYCHTNRVVHRDLKVNESVLFSFVFVFVVVFVSVGCGVP